MSLRRLQNVFDRSERALASGVPIRKTATGIWAPSSIPQIMVVARRLHEIGVLGAGAPPGPVVDAGSGDGRVPAVLASLEPQRPAYGIESDTALVAQAAENLRALRRVAGSGAVRLVAGDYCDVATYAACGIDLDAPLVVLNYPDGNQRPLAQFLARHAPSAALCLFTHDHEIDVDDLPLSHRCDLPAEAGPDWRLSVYRR